MENEINSTDLERAVGGSDQAHKKLEKRGSMTKFFNKIRSPAMKEENILKWERASSGDNSKRLTFSRMMKLKKTDGEFKEDVRPGTSQSSASTVTLTKKQSISGALKKMVPNWAQKKNSTLELKEFTEITLEKMDLQ